MDIKNLNPEQLEIATKIADACEKKGIDPSLGLAIGWAENKFKPEGKSKAGAIGPMQVLPSNAAGLGLKKEDLFNVDKNIEAGCEILKQNLDRFNGNVIHAVAGYNASTNTANKFASTNNLDVLPDETKNYIKKIDAIRPLDESGYIGGKSEEKTFGEVEPIPPHLEKEVVTPSNLPDSYNEYRRYLTGPEGEIDTRLLTGAGAVAGSGAGALEKMGEAKTLKAARELDASSAGQKWKAKTGFGKGEGETVQEVSEAYKRAKNKGKVSGKILPEESLNVNKILDKQGLARQAEQEALAKAIPSKLSKALGRVPGGSILAGGAGGAELAQALKDFESGNLGSAAIHAVGGVGNLMSLIPSPATRLLGGSMALGALPAEYAFEGMSENERRSKAGLAQATKKPEEIQYDPMGNPIY